MWIIFLTFLNYLLKIKNKSYQLKYFLTYSVPLLIARKNEKSLQIIQKMENGYNKPKKLKMVISGQNQRIMLTNNQTNEK